MQKLIFTEPYRFVPPRHSALVWRLIRWWWPSQLRKNYGVMSWEFTGVERLRASLDAGSGVLLASNHSRPCDPLMLGMLSDKINRPFHAMASWHLFKQSRVPGFLLQHIGGFSVYREGLDRESLKCAVRILAEAQFPLLIFPEGIVTRNNDRLLNLMDGVSFIARAAAKQRAASAKPGKVVVHPIFVRYFFEGDLAATITPVLQDIETRLAWQPQAHLPLRERIVKIGQAFVALKETEYLGAPQSGRVRERLPRLLECVLGPLEREWNTGRGDPDTMARVKRLRSAILPDMIRGGLTAEETTRRWRQFADLYLAQQLHCYSADYLDGTPTPERILETVERYEEDLTDTARPHPPLHAVLSIGEAIEATPTRDRGAENDPLADELQRRLGILLAESKTRRRIPRPAGEIL
ncbi:MAG: 1-acyl-sn-glycerol-3-phosphate acyltransferase [Chthoniobacteraceae bacterium]